MSGVEEQVAEDLYAEELRLPALQGDKKGGTFSTEKNKGTWRITNEGYLKQGEKIGSRKLGSGSVFVFDTPLAVSAPALLMSCIKRVSL